MMTNALARLRASELAQQPNPGFTHKTPAISAPPQPAKVHNVPKYLGENGRHVSTKTVEDSPTVGPKVEATYKSVYPFISVIDIEKFKAQLKTTYPHVLPNILITPEKGNIWIITFWPNTGD